MPPPNLSFVNPVLSLCCTFEFQPEGSRWSTRWSRPIRKGLSASTATASSTTLLWNIVNLSLQSFTQLRPLPLWRGKTRNWWRMRAATQWTRRSVQPEGLQRDSHILSSGPRAGRDTALLQKRERRKGTVLRTILLARFMRRTLQDCRSGPCKAVPRCYTLKY